MTNVKLKFFLIDFDGNIFIEDVKNLKNIFFSFPSLTYPPIHSFTHQHFHGAKAPTPNIWNLKLETYNFFRPPICLKKHPISFEKYKKAFNEVIREIKKGNTYLLNLTFPTKIETNLSLFEIYNIAKAPFKLYFKDKFACFSPERFVRIKNNKIYTYPMKGTIDASIPNAKEKILSNTKEMAEHTMVVDLLRNDLGIIGKNVKVNKFRFIDKIKAGDKKLLQVSSEIEASLPKTWGKKWLETILKILPAGSISGTPKKKTVEIIKRVEGYDRDYYTGIFGITDEKTFLDSAVIIRYIENGKDLSSEFQVPSLYLKTFNSKLKTQHSTLQTHPPIHSFTYKSGGGITINSNAQEEYEELINKVYIPI